MSCSRTQRSEAELARLYARLKNHCSDDNVDLFYCNYIAILQVLSILFVYMIMKFSPLYFERENYVDVRE